MTRLALALAVASAACGCGPDCPVERVSYGEVTAFIGASMAAEASHTGCRRRPNGNTHAARGARCPSAMLNGWTARRRRGFSLGFRLARDEGR
jgi:hypothetical protein